MSNASFPQLSKPNNMEEKLDYSNLFKETTAPPKEEINMVKDGWVKITRDNENKSNFNAGKSITEPEIIQRLKNKEFDYITLENINRLDLNIESQDYENMNLFIPNNEINYENSFGYESNEEEYVEEFEETDSESEDL